MASSRILPSLHVFLMITHNFRGLFTIATRDVLSPVVTQTYAGENDKEIPRLLQRRVEGVLIEETAPEIKNIENSTQSTNTPSTPEFIFPSYLPQTLQFPSYPVNNGPADVTTIELEPNPVHDATEASTNIQIQSNPLPDTNEGFKIIQLQPNPIGEKTDDSITSQFQPNPSYSETEDSTGLHFQHNFESNRPGVSLATSTRPNTVSHVTYDHIIPPLRHDFILHSQLPQSILSTIRPTGDDLGQPLRGEANSGHTNENLITATPGSPLPISEDIGENSNLFLSYFRPNVSGSITSSIPSRVDISNQENIYHTVREHFSPQFNGNTNRDALTTKQSSIHQISVGTADNVGTGNISYPSILDITTNSKNDLKYQSILNGDRATHRPLNGQGGNIFPSYIHTSNGIILNNEQHITKPKPQTITNFKPKPVLMGGIGNPSLLGFPLSLGDDTTYVVPSNEYGVTQKPVYGGVGGGILPLSVDTSRIDTELVNGEFFALPNKSPHHSSTPPINPTELFTTLSNLQYEPSGQGFVPNRHPISITSLISLVKNMTDYSKKVSHPAKTKLSSYTNNPYSNLFPKRSNVFSSQNLHSRTDIFEGEVIPYPQLTSKNSFLESQSKSNFLTNNLPDAFQSQEPNIHDHIASLEIKTADSESDKIDSIPKCLQDTWCGLGIAAAVAVGTISALTVPFLTPAVLGRKRRTVEHVVFSAETAETFANHYVRMLNNDSANIPEEEKILFITLHDTHDDSVRKVFKELEQFILNNKDDFLTMAIQEVDSNETQTIKSDSNQDYILIPDDILKNINEQKKEIRAENRQSYLNDKSKNATLPVDSTRQIQNNIHVKEILSTLTHLSSKIQSNPIYYTNKLANTPSAPPVKDYRGNKTFEKNIWQNQAFPFYSIRQTPLPFIQNIRYRIPTHSYLNLKQYQNKLQQQPTPQPQFHNNHHYMYSQPSYIKHPQSNSNIFNRPINKFSLIDSVIPYDSVSSPNSANISPQTQYGHNSNNYEEGNHYQHPYKHPGENHTPYGHPKQQIPTYNKPQQFHSNRINQMPVSSHNNFPKKSPNSQNSNLIDYDTSPLISVGHQYSALAIATGANLFDDPPNSEESISHNEYPSILMNLPLHFGSDSLIQRPFNFSNSDRLHQNSQPYSFNIAGTHNEIKTPNPFRATRPSFTQHTVIHPQYRPFNFNRSDMVYDLLYPNSMAGSHEIESPYPFARPTITQQPIINRFQTNFPISGRPNPFLPTNTEFNRIPTMFMDGHFRPVSANQHNFTKAREFYKSVCFAVGRDDIPDSNIIRFIRDKCNMFQYTGIIR